VLPRGSGNWTAPPLRGVDFHGSPLTTFEKDGPHGVALRSVVEGVGLDWPSRTASRLPRPGVLTVGLCLRSARMVTRGNDPHPASPVPDVARHH
jgi:hypothetical protein